MPTSAASRRVPCPRPAARSTRKACWWTTSCCWTTAACANPSCGGCSPPAAGPPATRTRTSPTSRRSWRRMRAASPSSRRSSRAAASPPCATTWRMCRTTPRPACARSSDGCATGTGASKWTTAARSRCGSRSIARPGAPSSISPAPRRSRRATSTRRSRSAPRPCCTFSARWWRPTSR